MKILLLWLQDVQVRRSVGCRYVLPPRDSNHCAAGVTTRWQRCVLQAIEEQVLTAEDRFTFHDLRAYYVTMHKRTHGHLPDIHANPAVTATTYDRTKEVKRESL